MFKLMMGGELGAQNFVLGLISLESFGTSEETQEVIDFIERDYDNYKVKVHIVAALKVIKDQHIEWENRRRKP